MAELFYVESDMDPKNNNWERIKPCDFQIWPETSKFKGYYKKALTTT